MAEVRDILLRIRGDSRDANRSLSGLKSSFTEINQAVELTKTAFGVARSGAEALFSALNQAQVLEGVTKGFRTLQAESGLLADQSLKKLRDATQGLVSDFELMQQANQAVQLGLDPSILDTMAEAATKLGAAVGRTANESFTDLITGVGRASPLILDNLGITVKAAEAQQRYADSLGITTKELTENQKAEAFRFAALEKIQEKASSLADVQLNAGQAAQRLGADFANLRNEVLLSLQSDTELRDLLLDLSDVIRNFDSSNIVAAIRAITREAADAIKVLDNWAFSIRSVTDAQGQMRDAVIRAERDVAKNTRTTEAQLENVVRLREQVDKATATFEKFANSKGVNHAWTQRAAGRLQGYRKALTEAESKLLDFEVATEGGRKKTEKLDRQLVQTKKTAEQFFDVFDQASVLTTAFFGAEDARAIETQIQELFGKIDQASQDAIEKGKQLQKEAYRESVGFFEDILIGAVEGNIEDVFKNMLTRAAVKFGAELLAQLTGNFSAQVLFGSAGGSGGFDYGQLIDYGTSAYNTYFGAGASTASTSGGATAATGATGAAGAAGLGATATTAGAALYAYLLYEGGKNAYELTQKPQDQFTRDDARNVTATLDLFATAMSGLNSVLGGSSGFQAEINKFTPTGLVTNLLLDTGLLSASDLNFGSGKGEEQRLRDQARGFLKDELGIIDENYLLDLFGGKQFDIGKELFGDNDQHISDISGNESFLGLGNLLSSVTQGGAAPENFDLGAMFTNALAATDNYNAAALTTLGILEDIGLNADSAGDLLTSALLDGGISIADFNSQIATLDMLSQDTLGSVQEGFELLADVMGGPPRDQLKALELLMGEFADQGIQDIQSIIAAFTEELGPEGAAAIEQLTAAGIDQFTDFSTLSNQQIGLVINVLSQLIPAMEGVGSSAQNAAGNVESAANRMVRGLGRARSEAQSLQERLDKLL